MPLLATAILSPSTPHAEAILTTAKKFGARYYRLGFVDRESDVAAQIREVRARLKDLAALNKKLGMTALLQNHSPAGHTYLGGDLSELSQLLEGFDPEQVGAAFDIGHALIVHKDQWRPHFERIKSHLKIAYVKDANKNGRWVPFGEGDVGQSGYFKLLKQLGYKAPLSLHIEFDWHRAGQAKDRATLVTALRESSTRLRKWLEES
jgi:sugar phosphate isomerase/epimerase